MSTKKTSAWDKGIFKQHYELDGEVYPRSIGDMDGLDHLYLAAKVRGGGRTRIVAPPLSEPSNRCPVQRGGSWYLVPFEELTIADHKWTIAQLTQLSRRSQTWH